MKTRFYPGIALLMILLFANVTQLFALDSKRYIQLMLLGGCYINTDFGLKYSEVENTGIVKAKMTNTLSGGLGVEINPSLSYLKIRSDILLGFPSSVKYTNWDGNLTITNTDGTIMELVGNNPDGYLCGILTITGNIIIIPWEDMKKPYFISGLGFKRYFCGEISTDIKEALFENKKRFRFAYRIGMGFMLTPEISIEVYDNMDRNNFLFRIPQMEKENNPNYVIHDIF
ncbi:hypothetical protein KKA87_15885, partial [bacterium]|nr:hypothetical protein [bacterium]